MSRPSIRAAVVGLVAGLCLLPAGCGDSKPSYCDKASELDEAVKQQKELKVPGADVGAFLSSVREVQAKASALMPEVRAEFPTEVRQVEGSLRTVAMAGKAIAAEPSVAGAAKLVRQADLLRAHISMLTGAVDESCE